MHRAFVALSLLVLASTGAVAAPWQGGGPDMAWVTSFVRPAGSGGPLYAGTYGGGVWRSDDDGATWTDATTNARDAVVWGLTAGSDIRSSLYAATADQGVLRSEDFSSGWFSANTGLAFVIDPGVYEIETFPLDPNRIVAATGSGARASRTRGDAWADTLIASGIQFVRAVEVIDELPRTVHYLGTEEIGIQRGSQSAREVYTQGAPEGAFFFDFDPWPGDARRFVVADFDGKVWNFDGAAFKSLGADAGFTPAPRFYHVKVTEGGGTPVIRVGADRGLFTSVDDGETWERTALGRSPVHAEIWSILVDDAATGSLVLGSFVDGVLRVPAGRAEWIPSNAGLRAAWVRSVDARDGVVLAGTAHGRLFRSLDGALTWDEVTGSLDDLQLHCVWIGDGSPWVVTAAGGVFATDDEGATWSPVSLPANATRLNAIVDGGDRLYAVSDDGLLESVDEGRSWTHVAGLDQRRSGFAVEVFGDRLAVGFDATPDLDGAVYVGNSVAGFTALDVAADTRARGFAFVDGGDGLLVARQGGVVGNLARVRGLEGPNPTVQDVTIAPGGQVIEPVDMVRLPGSSHVVMATASRGVLLSDDGGETFGPVNDGLVTERLEDLAFDVVDGAIRLAVGSFARGAWTRVLDDVVRIDDAPTDDAIPPRVTRVLPPMPNPFNPRTTIRWEQATDGDVTVEIFDLRGRRLRGLFRAPLVAGRHEVRWDGTDDQGRAVASGTYVARVRVGQRVHAARLTLVR